MKCARLPTVESASPGQHPGHRACMLIICGIVLQIMGGETTGGQIHAALTSHHPDTPAARRAADVAVQFGLGLLSQRRPWPAAHRIDRACCARRHLACLRSRNRRSATPRTGVATSAGFCPTTQSDRVRW